MEGPSSHVQAQRTKQDSKSVGYPLSGSTGYQSLEGACQGSKEGELLPSSCPANVCSVT